MSFYNSKRRSLISLGRSGSGIGEEFNSSGGGSCGSTSSSGSSNAPIMIGSPAMANNASATATATGGRVKSQPSYSLQQLARSRSFGGAYQTSGGSYSGGSTAARHKGSFYNNFINSRTGTWSSQHSPGLGVLGQGYGSPSGGVSRKLMNSLGTLTHSSGHGHANGTGTIPIGSTYFGTASSGHSSGGGGFGGLLGSNSQSTRTLPTSAAAAGGGGGHVIKTPRPNKTRIAIESLIRGLQDCIKQIEEEMSQVRSSIQDLTSIGENQSQGKLYELEKYSKSSERHLKRIEYQLSIVEELGEQYALQQKLREGVRTMAFAYSVSQGPEKETALANVKAGFRECTEMLCSLETQLEVLLGTFHMEMKGIQGFARLCPGDVFEITIKHGLQKWKTRGKVGKDGSQVWDLPLATFRAVLGEVMHIKAAEVKTLGKHILLGNKFCEISELFSSHAQLMTVNLNPTGSLKLNIIVSWNPLEFMDDYRHSPSGSVRSHSQNVVLGSPSRKRRLSPTEINFRHSMSSISPENTVSYARSNSDSGRGSTSKNTKTAMEVDEVGDSEQPGPSTSIAAAASKSAESEDISSKASKWPSSASAIQNPSSRHSALWERTLDSIEVTEANPNNSSMKNAELAAPASATATAKNSNANDTADSSSSVRVCSLTAPSKTSRQTSPDITIINKSENTNERASPQPTTIRVESPNRDAGQPKSTSKILIEAGTAGDEEGSHKHDPNVHRISIVSTDSSSSLTSDPSGNFSFVKKRSGSFPSSGNDGHTGPSQIEFETNIALEELDMAILDGDNSVNNITTIEETMEEFCSYGIGNGGEDDEGSFDHHHSSTQLNHSGSSNKINSGNIGLFTLRNSVLRLSSLLEDIQGQYHELEPLEMHLTTLEKMIQNPCFLNSSSSSLNIESALECFDFLDTEESQSQVQSPTSPSNNDVNSVTISELPASMLPNNVHETPSNTISTDTSPGVYIFGTSSRYNQHRHQANDILDPKMTARTTDSGISSLGHHSRSPSPTTSRNSSPMHTVTGSSQLDMALGAQISMCLQLIHNVGSFGPLKHREKEAISKLQQQGIIIGSILGRMKSHDASLTNGLLELASLPQLQVLWERITETGAPLCTSADNAIHGLELDIKSIIQCKYPQEYAQQRNLPRKVSHLLVQQMLETGTNEAVFDLGQVLTVFQFQNFLRPHEHSFHKLIDDLTEEEILQLNLQQNLVSGIRSLPLSVPPKNVLFTIIRLLTHEDPEVTILVKNYFNAISIAADKKRQIIETSLEMLESPAHSDRRAACLVFAELKSFWRIRSLVVEPLLYIIQTDRNHQVRTTAKETVVQILGDEEGERVLQQVALSTHGFQGLGIN